MLPYICNNMVHHIVVRHRTCRGRRDPGKVDSFCSLCSVRNKIKAPPLRCCCLAAAEPRQIQSPRAPAFKNGHFTRSPVLWVQGTPDLLQAPIGPTIPRRRAQDMPSWLQVGVRSRQAFHTFPGCPKGFPRWPTTAQHVPKMAQDSSKFPEDSPRCPETPPKERPKEPRGGKNQ